MCIFVERWFICPQHKNEGPPKKPTVVPRGSPDAKTPWVHWKHGEAVSREELEKLGFTSPNEWTYVRHNASSKIRCASWGAIFCDQAPHETWYRFYSSCCPDCTGDDVCVNANQPYRTDVATHARMCRTQGQFRALDDAAKAYWNSLMRTQSSTFHAEYPGFPSQEPYDDMAEELGHVFHLFNALACTEDHSHIYAHEGDQSDCDHCDNMCYPAAHNPLRALFQQEARVVWENSGDMFTENLEYLESAGFLRNIRKLRKAELKVHQDWMAEDMGQGGNSDRMVSLDLFRDELKKARSQVENDGERGYRLWSWNRTVDLRHRFATRLGKLLLLDPGLSSEFLDRLFIHVHSILIPWPRIVKGKTLVECPPNPSDVTKAFVKGLDTMHDSAWADRFYHEDALIRALLQNKQALQQNVVLADEAAESYLEKVTIPFEEAKLCEECCAICGDEWLPSHSLPPHLFIVKMPCCDKPFHHACMKQIMRPWRGTPKCPMCRTDITKFGWFGKEFQETLVPLDKPVEGFVPWMLADWDDDDDNDEEDGNEGMNGGANVFEYQVDDDYEEEEELGMELSY